MKKENFFKKKKTTSGFALAALIAGFIFLGSNSITGNAIVDNTSSVNFVSIIGLALIACSVVLGIYSIHK